MLFPVCGRPMIDYVLDAWARPNRPIVVIVGHRADLVRQAVADDLEWNSSSRRRSLEPDTR